MSRYTSEVLMEHAKKTDTGVVRAVFPDCPTDRLDTERSAVRRARRLLIPKLVDHIVGLTEKTVQLAQASNDAQRVARENHDAVASKLSLRISDLEVELSSAKDEKDALAENLKETQGLLRKARSSMKRSSEKLDRTQGELDRWKDCTSVARKEAETMRNWLRGSLALHFAIVVVAAALWVA